jgi:hypothetical protein
VKRIGGGVRRELERFGPAAGMADLVAAWPRLVGEQIARNAWPARLGRDGTLHVAASSSAWAFELAQLAPQVLESLQQGLGDGAPVALRFAPGKLPELSPEPAETAAEPPPRPTAEQAAQAADLAAPIADENLRKVVAKAAAASLARAADNRSVW